MAFFNGLNVIKIDITSEEHCTVPSGQALLIRALVKLQSCQFTHSLLTVYSQSTHSLLHSYTSTRQIK